MHGRQLYIGLMSGTSADGIDAALVDLQNTPKLLASHTHPFSNQLRGQIHSLCLPGTDEIDLMGALDAELGKHFAQATRDLLEKSAISADQIIAIGSHGQTIRHRPPGSDKGNFTLQIGDPNLIAELTGITTVADFRRRDMAVGGQGAPLVPAFHNAFFHSSSADKVVVNIGGMANITWLPANGHVCGFDTGPGNALMDAWISQHHGHPYDADGNWAKTGAVITCLLDSLLSDPFFCKPSPKSTGRESFNLHWLEKHIRELPFQVSATDVQATLLELTGKSIAESIKSLSKEPATILICGGGAFNKMLLERLATLLPKCCVTTTANYGVDPQWIEAMAFAWLAKQTINHRPGNLRAVTGASREVILGGVYYAR